MSVIKIKDKPSINDNLEFIGALYPKYWFEDEYNLEKRFKQELEKWISIPEKLYVYKQEVISCKLQAKHGPDCLKRPKTQWWYFYRDKNER